MNSEDRYIYACGFSFKPTFTSKRVREIIQAFHDTMTEVTERQPVTLFELSETAPTNLIPGSAYANDMKEKHPGRSFTDIRKLTDDISLYNHNGNKTFKDLQKIEVTMRDPLEGGPSFKLTFNRETRGSGVIHVEMSGGDVDRIQRKLWKKGVKLQEPLYFY